MEAETCHEKPGLSGRHNARLFFYSTLRRISIDSPEDKQLLSFTPRKPLKNWSKNMRKRKSEVVSIHEIPPELIGGIVLADLAQIRTAADTHPDSAARDRIYACADRLQQIASGSLSPALMEEIHTLNEVNKRLKGQA
jgi:hypothetical protein